MKAIEINGYTRINKLKAINMFNRGETVYAIPCNLMAKHESMFHLTKDKGTFDKLIINIIYYNCNKEAGNQLWYSMKKPSKKYKMVCKLNNIVRLKSLSTGHTENIYMDSLIQKIQNNEIELIGYKVSSEKNCIVEA